MGAPLRLIPGLAPVTIRKAHGIRAAMISFVDCIDGETEAPKEDTAFADCAQGPGVRAARNMSFVVSFQFGKQHPGTSKDVVQDLSIHWEKQVSQETDTTKYHEK